MCQLVCSEIPFLCKSSSAFFRSIRFLSCMYNKRSKISKWPRQTEQTQTRLLLRKQSDQGLPCLLLICVNWCVLRFPFCVNLRPHFSHAYGFTPVCTVLNANCLPKRPRQTVQTQIRLLLRKQSDQGLPCLLLICVNWCVLRFPFCVNLRPHFSQAYGFSPV